MRLVIVGYGNIGRGLVETLAEKRSSLKKGGLDVKVVAVCEYSGCIVDESGVDLKRLLKEKPRWGKRKTLDVINEVDADIVVELTPGDIKSGEPGLKHIRAALESGKHVVTSNKSPLVVAYGELVKLAEDNGVMLKFEATVGGAIPVLNTLDRELKSNKARNVYGILNGTTNFILTKMLEEGVDFKAALLEAQTLGLAETDPTYDIEGIDSAAKVVILANSLGMDVKFKDLKVVGITGVTPEAVDLAKEHGYTIKLVGDIAAKEVSPRLVPLDHPLNVGGSLNAVLVDTDVAGEITLIGAGAGPRETSSAIMSDINAIAEKT
ncbi:MAG: homoserine dehydrogenase [Candidatus Altiarchaeales archaeon]|nr:homoserine dehydrogenase [Candidatus Altiarchaeales archaeon]MBD3417253.1 homoserine dehydrogenase [Candidatus Altiarchaeales archaeon]